jgi:hypothetical protein
LVRSSRRSPVPSTPTRGHSPKKFQPKYDPSRDQTKNNQYAKTASHRHSPNKEPKHTHLHDGSTRDGILNISWKTGGRSQCTDTRRRINCDSKLEYRLLTDHYAEMASRNLVKNIRFGRTFASAYAAVQRVIRQYETSMMVDPEVLEDEKLYRKSLKSHQRFEAQEKLSILEDACIVDEKNQNSKPTLKLLEELASTPIVVSNQVRIRSARAPCKNCQLCHESSCMLLSVVATFTPGMKPFDDFGLEEDIDKNTLDAANRLKHSLDFWKRAYSTTG